MSDFELDRLGRQYGTDKASDRHNYLRHYEALFGPRRERVHSFLEIGVLNGASTAMWTDYFDQALVVGIDCDASCVCFEKGRTRIRIGSQADPAFLAQVAAEFGPFDIILDDGSHNGEDQHASFAALYSQVQPGGLYVIEDLHTSYFGWGRPIVEYITGELLEKVVWPGGRTFSHGHGDPRNQANWPVIRSGMDAFSRQTKSIQFFSSLVVFEKWPAWEQF